MARIEWDLTGQNRFETGVERGVLYTPVDGAYQLGVAWRGLIDVQSRSIGGDSKSYYFNGVKYAEKSANTDFELNLEAYFYPKEFEQFDGTNSISGGMQVSEQKRKPFGLSYRTRVGNDTEGVDYGFRIHLVYGCVASPTARGHSTIGAIAGLSTFNWRVSTVPVDISGFRPSAHVVFNSWELSPQDLTNLEAVLYGDDTNDPRLPTPAELKAMLVLDSRFITVVSSPNPALIPASTETGDVVFAQSNRAAYSWGEYTGNDRLVLATDDVDNLPGSIYPGDIVYDETTGDLYQVGE